MENENNDSSVIFDYEKHLHELCIGFLASFYHGRNTQSSLKNNLEVLNSLHGNKLPKSFDQLSDYVLNLGNDRVNYVKKWYCNHCNAFVEVDNSRQRECLACRKK